MKKPCECCPFRRGTPMRLTKGRVREVVGGMLNPGGGEFPCHRTIEHHEDGEGFSEKKNCKHCAGALIFAEKNGTATQMMRICERIGMYDAATLMANQEVVDSVFDDFQEALEHLTSPQNDPLNNSVDSQSDRIQTDTNARNQRRETAGGAKRRGRNVEGSAISHKQNSRGAQRKVGAGDGR
jgi:hypothetical protein